MSMSGLIDCEKFQFPLSCFWYSDEFRFYYAYGNTPAQDFLQNCHNVKKPAILALGCGDIRSCFYTLWKNFDVQSVPRFDGVDFILNDISAAVLARNIIFLALCLQVPSTENDYKKWLSCVWAIWYCHELYPEHQKVLEDCLQMLCKHSDSWTSSDNPLYPMVKFTSPSTLAEVAKVWKMWLRRDIHIASVKEMQVSRSAELTKRGTLFTVEKFASDFVTLSTEISNGHVHDASILDAQKAEVVSYMQSGNAYAESVLRIDLPTSSTSVNMTFYERGDGRYTLHHTSVPYNCYYHTVQFTKSMNVKTRADFTKSLPFLANSVQQLSLWFQSSHKVLSSSHKHVISFVFSCSHALNFCSELKTNTVDGNEFDAIYSSNLIDHLGPPNIVLSAIPLLKSGGHLFTTTLYKHRLFDTLEHFVTYSFGFDCKLLPVLLGIRCINNEGVYANSVAVQPSPSFYSPISYVNRETLLVWEKVNMTPHIFPPGSSLAPVFCEAMTGAVKAAAYSLLDNPKALFIMCNLCIETAIQAFLIFMANSCADFSSQFWRPLCDSIQQTIKPFLNCMQMQLFLHGIHMHLTVTDDTCPLCQNRQLSTLVGLFCVGFQPTGGPGTPKFMAIVHKERCDDANHLCELARKNGSADIHIFDCFYASSVDGEVKLYFYAPLQLAAKEEYRLTVVSAVMAKTFIGNMTNMYSNVAQNLMLKELMLPFRCFKFSQPLLCSPVINSESVGSIISHLSNGDSSEVEISMSSTVNADRLEPKLISVNQIKLLYNHQTCSTLNFPYPVNFNNIEIKVSKKNRKIYLHCPRTCHKFEEKSRLFIASPDKELSLLPFSPSEETLRLLCGQQFSTEERRITDSLSVLLPPLVNVKQAFSSLFQFRDCNYFNLAIGGKSVHGLIFVNKRLYDYENKTPVIDLAFCLLEESFVDNVVPAWISLQPHGVKMIDVSNDAEYDLYKRVFTFFASRTHGTCTSCSQRNSRFHLLIENGIQQYFTRAVIYPLFCSEDFLLHEHVSSIQQQEEGKEKCDNCYGCFEDVKKCSKCKKTQYCSKGCQVAHWKIHKSRCKQSKVVVKNTDTKTTPFRPFSLTRYCHYGDFRFYYGYGNTPAEDFLENCHEIEEPEILLLGCGDIRSCFYTFWKNFDFSISKAPKRFDGVHFTLNDNSAAVLARNIIFLYLCLELPENTAEKKKWLSAVWAIWYCHELYPHHQQVLNESLKLLIKYSGSVEQWNRAENPLHCLVSFTSPTVLAEISQFWKLWFERTIPATSVDQMRSARYKELLQRGIYQNFEMFLFSYTFESLYINGDNLHRLDKKIENCKTELLSYTQSGSCYAETVMSRQPLEQQPTVVNLTFYEKPDGVYNLHYGSMPFSCYHHTLEFSPSLMKEAGLACPPISSMLVPAESFESHPYLANSVQQFSMWIQSASRTLKDTSYRISFKFNNLHAVSFCQELQYHGSDQNNGQFDLINASNLMDHLGPPNIILPSIPLLKPKGFLFASTLLYRNFSPTIEDFLHMSFGFDCKLLPVVLGIRCINHEGVDYSSPVMAEPKPPTMSNMIVVKRHERMLIFEKVTTQPFKFIQLPQLKSGNVTDALLDFVKMSVYALLKGSKGLQIVNNSCIEVAVLVLQTFLSFANGSNDHSFWKPLTTKLTETMKSFLHSFQIQSFLHNLHIHLTVSENDCPICQDKPLEESIGMFCAELSLPIQYLTPNFLVLVHKIPSFDAQYLCNLALAGNEVHVIDCMDGTIEDHKLKLRFYAPLMFVTQGYNVTVALTYMLSDNRNVILTVIPSASMKDFQIPFEHFDFLQTVCSRKEPSEKEGLGVITSLTCDGDQIYTEIRLSDSSLKLLASNKLTTKMLAPDILEISCGSLGHRLETIYPINYDKTSIKVSKKNGTITLNCPRQGHEFYNEKPLFIVSPDHQLSLPPTYVNDGIIICLSGMQRTTKEREISILCNREHALMPPLLNLKESLIFFFQCRNKSFFMLVSRNNRALLGVVVVNSILYDYQHRTPVADVAFCFTDYSNEDTIMRNMLSIAKFQETQDILIDDAEFKILQRTMNHFANRTNGNCKTACKGSRLNSLVQGKIDRFFKRAAVYLLYCDPDQIGTDMGKGLDMIMTHEVPQPGNPDIDDKCDYCGKYSPNTKQCSKCKKVKYCSKNCQEKDWSKHSSDCRKAASKSSTSSSTLTAMTEEAEACAYCEAKSGNLLACTRCNTVKYCGKNCQKNHWLQHKAKCQKKEDAAYSSDYTSPLENYVPPSAFDSSAPKAMPKCAFCEASSGKLLTCTRCGMVKYCGKECQKKHWKEHKKLCHTVAK